MAACEHPSDTNTQTHTRIHLHQTMFTNMDTHTHHGVNSVWPLCFNANQVWINVYLLYSRWCESTEFESTNQKQLVYFFAPKQLWLLHLGDGTAGNRDFQLWFEWNLYRFPLTPTSMSVTFLNQNIKTCVSVYNLCWTSENWTSKKNLFGHEEQIQRELCTLA